MDQSRLSAVIPGLESSLVPDADVVIVNLARGADAVAQARAAAPTARLIAYGPHVDDALMEAARAAGADVVLPRSTFFRDPSAHLAPPP